MPRRNLRLAMVAPSTVLVPASLWLSTDKGSPGQKIHNSGFQILSEIG